ncbi:hypothetical protein [Halothiobacillus sp.]|uniref:hypothetical protein n=1 Tax=Halothiobacillus sp. TaxID=1891311 RepID=UPI003D0D6AC8
MLNSATEANFFDEPEQEAAGANAPVATDDDRPSGVILSEVGPLIAALARKPDYANLASDNQLERERAEKMSATLIEASIKARSAVAAAAGDLYANRTRVVKAINTVIADAWLSDKDLSATIKSLATYAKTVKDKTHEWGAADHFVFGSPSLADLRNPVESATDIARINSGLMLSTPISDADLREWLISEVANLDPRSVAFGLTEADTLLKNSLSMQFMSDRSREVVRCASGVFFARAHDTYHMKGVENFGEPVISRIMGTFTDHMDRARKNVVERAIDAVDGIKVDDGAIPSEMDVARAIGSAIEHIGRPWINTRIALIRQVLPLIPEGGAAKIKAGGTEREKVLAVVQSALTEKQKEISERVSVIAKQGTVQRDLILSAIANTNAEGAASTIKTRGALVTRCKLTNMDDINRIEHAMSVIAEAHEYRPEPDKPSENAAPAEGGLRGALSSGFKQAMTSVEDESKAQRLAKESATINSVMRQVVVSMFKGGAGVDASSAIESMDLSMDAIDMMSGMNVSESKHAIKDLIASDVTMQSRTDDLHRENSNEIKEAAAQ